MHSGFSSTDLCSAQKVVSTKRIIDGLRAGPDFLQAQWADHARIARQMRFIVPNKAGAEDLVICDENEST